MTTPLEHVKAKRSEAIRRKASAGYNARRRVYVGQATCEIAAGSNEVWDVFEEAIKNGLTDTYLSAKGCAGLCNLEPMVEVIEANRIPVKYCRVTIEKAREIVRRHLVLGEVIHDWTIR